MFKCYLTNMKTGSIKHLSDVHIEAHDDNEFRITIEITDPETTNQPIVIQPIVMIGDIEIEVEFKSELNDQTVLYTSVDGGFFDNAFFLNYFGECELSVALGDIKKSYIVEVNVTGYKANIAKEMLLFLSDNADDILQTCYSKSKTGFAHKDGDTRDIIKFSALTQTVELIESLFHAFKSDNKYNIKHGLQYNSNKPVVVDDTSVVWLAENMDELEVANSSQYKLRIKQKYYQADIPNSVIHFDADLKENRVLHQFVLVARKYLTEIRSKIDSQTQNISADVEYSEYVKFDQVIKGMINPILMMRLRAIDLLIKRINRIHLFFKATISVKKLAGEMPVQTSYTLRHRHYAKAFNGIAEFYKASDADKLNSEFLLGLRNLSQLFELCCLYYFVCYFKKISVQVSASWVSNDFGWTGPTTDKLNILANNFLFENEHYEYTLNYEKQFYSLSQEKMLLQRDNLVRLDQSNNYYEPDFTLKILNKKTRDYYFVILDAKFSRSYKMRNTKSDKVPSVLQSVFTKYGTNLKTYKDGDLVNLTRYIGVIFGLSKSEQEQKRINMFSKLHDIDGIAPIFPYAAADFISFSEDNLGIERILNKYVSQ